MLSGMWKLAAQGGVQARRQRRRTPRHPALFRPRLEVLESRLAPAVLHVTTTADSVDANDGALSLREAITQANSTAAADVITLPAGTYRVARAGAGEDANATGDFDVKNPLTIVGQGASSTLSPNPSSRHSACEM